MVHIVFGDSAAATLKEAVLKKKKITNETVITVQDIFSVGPIWHLNSKQGLEQRFQWMSRTIKENDDEYEEEKHRELEAINQIEHGPKEQPVTIWISESASEQTGLRYVLYLLKENSNQIRVINTTKIMDELFCVPGQIQYVVKHTGEIAPEKFVAIYEEAAKINFLEQSERSRVEAEWLELAESSDNLRIWQDGRIKNLPENYYDKYIADKVKKLHNQQAKKEYIKSARVIGEVLGTLEQHLGDEFLQYRLRELIKQGIFEVEGNMKAMRLYSVRFKGE